MLLLHVHNIVFLLTFSLLFNYLLQDFDILKTAIRGTKAFCISSSTMLALSLIPYLDIEPHEKITYRN